jgi:aquaporin Z
LTFIFVMVIWGTGIDERGPRVGGFAIGLTLAALILAFGPLTGVALNPARFLGPAAVAGNVDDWWVYFVGPGIGATVAGLTYQTLFWDGFPLARLGGSLRPAPGTLTPTPSSALEEPPAPRAARKAGVKRGARKAAPRKR